MKLNEGEVKIKMLKRPIYNLTILFAVLLAFVMLTGIDQCSNPFVATKNGGAISGRIHVGTSPLPEGVPESAKLEIIALDAEDSIVESVQVSTISEEYMIDGLPPGIYKLQINVPRYYLLDSSADQLERLTDIAVTDETSIEHDVLLWVYVPDRIHVDFKSDSTEDQRNLLIAENDCEIIWSAAGVVGTQKTIAYRLDIPDDKTELDIVEIFRKNPSVLSAEVVIQGSFN